MRPAEGLATNHTSNISNSRSFCHLVRTLSLSTAKSLEMFALTSPDEHGPSSPSRECFSLGGAGRGSAETDAASSWGSRKRGMAFSESSNRHSSHPCLLGKERHTDRGGKPRERRASLRFSTGFWLTEFPLHLLLILYNKGRPPLRGRHRAGSRRVHLLKRRGVGTEGEDVPQGRRCTASSSRE